MKAAVLRAPGRMEVVDIPAPCATEPGEVVVSVSYTGICKTDHHLAAACPSSNIVLGHEVVCRLPDEPPADVYYVLNNELSCGWCGYCEEGLTSHCSELVELGVNRDGGYAEYLLVPRRNLHPLRVEMPAVGVLAEPMSCAVRGAARILATQGLLPPNQGEMLIVGGGISGKLVAYALRRRGYVGRLRMFDISREPLGWPEALDVEQLSHVPTGSHHVVIECSGSVEGVATAFEAVRNAGRVCLYGVPPEGVHLPVSANALFKRELSVMTSFAGTTERTLSEAISYLEQDESFFQQLVGRFVELEDLGHELEYWRPRPGTRTVVNVGARAR